MHARGYVDIVYNTHGEYFSVQKGFNKALYFLFLFDLFRSGMFTKIKYKVIIISFLSSFSKNPIQFFECWSKNPHRKYPSKNSNYDPEYCFKHCLISVKG